jgi:hypothetical protein
MLRKLTTEAGGDEADYYYELSLGAVQGGWTLMRNWCDRNKITRAMRILLLLWQRVTRKRRHVETDTRRSSLSCSSRGI